MLSNGKITKDKSHIALSRNPGRSTSIVPSWRHALHPRIQMKVSRCMQVPATWLFFNTVSRLSEQNRVMFHRTHTSVMFRYWPSMSICLRKGSLFMWLIAATASVHISFCSHVSFFVLIHVSADYTTLFKYFVLFYYQNLLTYPVTNDDCKTYQCRQCLPQMCVKNYLCYLSLVKTRINLLKQPPSY